MGYVTVVSRMLLAGKRHGRGGLRLVVSVAVLLSEPSSLSFLLLSCGLSPSLFFFCSIAVSPRSFFLFSVVVFLIDEGERKMGGKWMGCCWHAVLVGWHGTVVVGL